MKFSCCKTLVALTVILACRSLVQAVPTVTIGQNFLGSTFGIDTSATPADCNGAIGLRHYVEFLNGTFAVFNKTNGSNVKRISDLKFWSNSGVILSTSDAVSDPRIIYDSSSQRWFATMVDFDANAPSDPTLEANDFLFAVSATSDPTGVWRGFLFQADPDTGAFADFPTIGVDANAVYISGDMYHGETNPIGPSLVSIPKADLLLATPTIANRKWFGVMDYDVRGQVLEPAICFDGSAVGKILATSDIGNSSDPQSNLVAFAVQNGGSPAATLTTSTIVPTLPWTVPDNVNLGVPQFGPIQPDGTDTLQGNDARFAAKIYAVGGVIYAVHNTEFNGHVAIRWYRIRAADNVRLEQGTIADPNLDLIFPSIAANSFGVVVIGYNGCGLSTPISSFAIAGQTKNGVTTFGSPTLLKAGAASYHDLYEQIGFAATSRWGDYSATSVDPADPNRFWTSQMFPSDSETWATQITELITTPDLLLSIRRSGTNVTLYWPIAFPAFHLQSNTNLVSAASWTNVTQTVVTNGFELDVTLPATASRQFFRLRSP